MAANLAAVGHSVAAWNRSETTAPEGITLVESPAEVARHASVAFVMVRDAEAVEQILWGSDGWAGAARQGHVLIQSSTVSPGQARNLAERLSGEGIEMLDAPVSGSVEPAVAGQLTVLGGGKASLFHDHAPLFDAIAQLTVHFGDVGAGSASKLVVNSVLVAAMAAAAEGVTWLTEEVPNLDVAKIEEVLKRISPVAAKRAGALAGSAPSGGFTLELVAKDMDLADNAIPSSPVVSAVASICRAAAESGLRAKDLAALGEAARRRRANA
jgi:3-hydroxyisobutyrate dehydrogenase